MSSTSNMFVGALMSLHLIEHSREGLLQSQRLLDLLGCDVGILAVFEETRTLVVADEFDERRRVRSPVLRKAFEILEYCIDAVLREETDGVLRVFIEIRVEDTLV